MLTKLFNYAIALPALRYSLPKAYHWLSQNVKLLPPVGVVIEMTYACNWRCSMCMYYHEGAVEGMQKTVKDMRKTELSTEEIKKFIDDVADMGVRHISLHGGEPLVRRDFADVVTHAADRGLHTSTFSNATLITEELAELFTKKLHVIGVSVHGSEEFHDAVTKTPGSWKKAMNGIRLIQEAKKRTGSEYPQIRMSCILSAANYLHMEDMVDVVKQAGLDECSFGVTTFTNDKALDATRKLVPPVVTTADPYTGDFHLGKAVLDINGDEYLAAVSRLTAKAKQAGVKVFMRKFKDSREVSRVYNDAFFLLGKACNYPWLSSFVSTYGAVAPCVPFSQVQGYTMGNIRDQSFKDIWYNPEYKSFRGHFAKANNVAPLCAKCCMLGEGEYLS